jgi:hypothetical protein
MAGDRSGRRGEFRNSSTCVTRTRSLCAGAHARVRTHDLTIGVRVPEGRCLRKLLLILVLLRRTTVSVSAYSTPCLETNGFFGKPKRGFPETGFHPLPRGGWKPRRLSWKRGWKPRFTTRKPALGETKNEISLGKGVLGFQKWLLGFHDFDARAGHYPSRFCGDYRLVFARTSIARGNWILRNRSILGSRTSASLAAGMV